MELVGAKYRSQAGVIIEIPFAVGEAIAGIFAYFIRDWRTFQYVTSVPLFLCCLIHFFVPESPRWLLANGKFKELQASVSRISEMNKKSLSPTSQKRFNAMLAKMESHHNEEVIDDDSDADGEHIGLVDVFKHPLMRKCLLVMFVNWMVVTLGYYGLSMIAVEIGDDVFTSGILTALIEIPSYVFCLVFMDKLGRKPICVFTLFLTGITCIPAGFVTGTFQTVLALAGKIKMFIVKLMPQLFYFQENLAIRQLSPSFSCIQLSCTRPRFAAQLWDCVRWQQELEGFWRPRWSYICQLCPLGSLQ